MTTTTRPAAASPPLQLTHREILTILYGLMIAMFLAALDQTVVSTAIKTIGNDLHGLAAQAWVTTSFLATSTIAALLFGKLSDIFGRKRLFMLAIVIFVIGSVLCGLSGSMYELAAFRAVQGIGAGGIMPLALAIIGDIIPPRERARYQGYMMATFASSSVLGPVLGGLFAGRESILGVTGWRWIFYINVPIAALALVVIARVLKTDNARRKPRIDWFGAAALSIGLVPLLIVAEQGNGWGWASPQAFGCYFIGAAGLAGFVAIEVRMGPDALLPMRLFQNRTFSVAAAQVTVIGMAMFACVSVLPLYLQIVSGASPTKSGLLMLPLIGGLMATSMIVGQIISRTGRYKIFPVIGSVVMVIGVAAMTQIAADTPVWQTDICMLAFGIGLGMNMQSLVLAMQNAAEAKNMGVASASSTFFRSIGGTLGTAISLSILFSLAGTRIAAQYGRSASDPAFMEASNANPGQVALVHDSIRGGIEDTSFLSTLDATIRQPFLVGFTDAVDVVFLACAILLVLSVVLSACLKEVPLRLLSGNQARAEEEAAELYAMKVL